ncbi:MAG: hypothetical protein KY476_03440 [Planctomycetes bacterium]|nr:hypothetical protein [Planctomycetota bacterium]
MIPKREEFILDVRRVMRLVRPVVSTDSGVVRADSIGAALRSAALWLSPTTVEQFEPAEFADVQQGLQQELVRAVAEFRAIAEAVPADAAATEDQFRQGVDAFQQLVEAVRGIVLPEWQTAAAELVAQAEEWCEAAGWRARRLSKQLAETLLGSYSLPQLQLYAEQNLYVLNPVARFVPAAMGAFELSIQPSFDLTGLYRDFSGKWYVHLGIGQPPTNPRSEPWTRETFRAAVEELRSCYDQATAAP